MASLTDCLTDDYFKLNIERRIRREIEKQVQLEREQWRLELIKSCFNLHTPEDEHERIDLQIAKIRLEIKRLCLLLLIEKATALFNRARGLSKQLKKTDTPPTTITLETIRTSAGVFRRVGICA